MTQGRKQIQGMTKVKVHDKKVNIIIELAKIDPIHQ